MHPNRSTHTPDDLIGLLVFYRRFVVKPQHHDKSPGMDPGIGRNRGNH